MVKEAPASSPVFAIVVAAGSGSRCGGDVPKQFQLLAGKPVVMHAIERLRKLRNFAGTVLVLNPSHFQLWDELCKEYKFESPRHVAGGDSRSQSVRNALDALPEEANTETAIVLVHDGARPLVDVEAVTNNILSTIRQSGVECVIPCRPVTDTLMTSDYADAQPVDRSRFVAVQTPQAFRGSSIIEAYRAMPLSASLTDDASVAATYAGAKIHLAEGSPQTIKITYPTDLALAETLLNQG